MLQTAQVISFSSAFAHTNIIQRIKDIVKDSSHTHEHVAYYLMMDLEQMANDRLISFSDMDIIMGKAMDVLSYFHCDFDTLAKESTWYRAAIINQMCCGIMQVIRVIRPDLNHHHGLSEIAHQLYCYSEIGGESVEETASQTFMKCKYWA